MVAVDLNDLVDSLKREVSPPGVDLFPDASDDDYVGNLSDAFWEARLDGMLVGFEERDSIVATGFTELNGIFTPEDGTDLTRDLQQLIVLYAGMRIVRNHLMSLNTVFRTKAGPVEFETQKSANLLTGLLAELKVKRDIVLRRLSDVGSGPASYYIDAVYGREVAIDAGSTFHWR